MFEILYNSLTTDSTFVLNTAYSEDSGVDLKACYLDREPPSKFFEEFLPAPGEDFIICEAGKQVRVPTGIQVGISVRIPRMLYLKTPLTFIRFLKTGLSWSCR